MSSRKTTYTDSKDITNTLDPSKIRRSSRLIKTKTKQNETASATTRPYLVKKTESRRPPRKISPHRVQSTTSVDSGDGFIENNGRPNSGKLSEESRLIDLGEMSTDDIVQGRNSGSCSEESDSCWEDVDEEPVPTTSKAMTDIQTSTEKPPPTISIDVPVIGGKRKRQREDLEAFLRRKILKIQREITVDIHKTHVLCLIANGRMINEMLNCDILKSLAMSVLPQEFPMKNKFTLETVDGVLKLLSARYTVKDQLPCTHNYTERELVKCFGQSELSWLAFVYLVIVTFRFLKVETRLCISLHPLSIKFQPVKKKPVVDSKLETVCVKTKSAHKPSSNKPPSRNLHELDIMRTLMNTEGVDQLSQGNIRCNDKVAQQCYLELIDSEIFDDKTPSKKLKRQMESDFPRKVKDHVENKHKKSKNVNRKNETVTEVKVSRNKRKSTIGVKYTEDLDDDKNSQYFSPPGTSKTQNNDFTETNIGCKSKRKFNKSNKHVLSTDLDTAKVPEEACQNIHSGLGRDVWMEVYLCDECRWVCLDCIDMKHDQPSHLENLATKPLSYVISYDDRGCMKDVTRRYSSSWLKHTGTRRLRAAPDWLAQSLSPFRRRNRKQDEMEDVALEERLQLQPLPKSISEFKNHPLYVLPRHLLKYEAIFPREAEIVGYFKSEPVYWRACVRELHTRETWLKQARVVKVGEQPYKTVKGRKSPKQLILDGNGPRLLELFGLWQTKDYEPPTAEGGVVPRNVYGNVDLFLPRMLPKRTVHLRIPNLDKVARKLEIDCAPAMVGWDFHGSWCHPVMDGFIICEEFKDVLLDAWRTERQNMDQKEKEKQEKRAINNWKLLLKGLMIREKLMKKYKTAEKQELCSEEGATNLTSWPANVLSSVQQNEDEDHEDNLFPFEKI